MSKVRNVLLVVACLMAGCWAFIPRAEPQRLEHSDLSMTADGDCAVLSGRAWNPTNTPIYRVSAHVYWRTESPSPYPVTYGPMRMVRAGSWTGFEARKCGEQVQGYRLRFSQNEMVDGKLTGRRLFVPNSPRQPGN